MWKIVFIATAFNLLAEYSLRGVNNLPVIPLLPLGLFLNYFPYFMMMEDLITRFRLRDYEVAIAGLFFGVLWQLIGPSGVFLSPRVLGVNWGALLFVNLVWWVPIQTVMAFYLANRLAPRDWGHPLLSRIGWAGAFLAFVGMAFLFRVAVRNAPPLDPTGAAILVVTLLATAGLFRHVTRGSAARPRPLAAAKDRVLDGLGLFLVVYFVFSAIFLAGDPAHFGSTLLNRTALRVGVQVSGAVVLVMVVYRLASKRPIVV